MNKKFTLAVMTGAFAGFSAFLFMKKRKTKQASGQDPTATSTPGSTAFQATTPFELPEKESPIYTSGPVSPTGQPLYDFKDEHNLIFCEETQLSKRLIQLENSINIRDIGGYTGYQGGKVKWRKVIRSEELAHLSDKDVEFFHDLRLKHVFDFRNESKARKQVDRLPSSTQYHLNPIFDSLGARTSSIDFTQPGAVDSFMRGVYHEQTEQRAQRFADVLKYLTIPTETPLLYHCTNGKDRTGFMTYLLLGILGVNDETILSDYTLTNLTFDESYQVLGNIMSEELGVDNHHLWEFYGVKPDWLKISMDYINGNYGHVEAYLLDQTDMTQTDFEKIRDNLLE
ncbi:tyrosine-protein phosphatase [Eubacteriaceae bacterium ES3]|nr:tyrosine-protein phosphatase [Eubacteriaceae bacterium ES3]